MTDFSREYGEGLYALCAEENIEKDVLEQVLSLKDIFRQNPDYIRLLGNMSMPKGERCAIVDETLKGQVHEYVLSFLKLLTERGAAYAFAECADAYRNCYNQDHGVVEADVTTARPLNEEQRERLKRRLESMTGREIVIKEKVDPALMGGVLLQMDGKRYDNTVLNRLKTIKQTIAGE